MHKIDVIVAAADFTRIRDALCEVGISTPRVTEAHHQKESVCRWLSGIAQIKLRKSSGGSK